MPLGGRSGSDHLLQRNDVGIDRANDLGGSRRIRPAVEAAAAVDVVSGDTKRAPVGVTHRGAKGATGAIAPRITCMAKLKSEIEVTCPCCRSSLVIDLNLG